MSDKTADDIKNQIEEETDPRDMLLHDIADHGVRNVIHWIDYSDDEANEIDELAKSKIRELQNREE